MAIRRRLDAELVRRNLAQSREAARRLIDGGKVTVGGSVADKPARQVLTSDALEILSPPPPFVSRAGGKLAAALAEFEVDPEGLTCLDAGSSTGGFTDCLLQAGAEHVHSVDVGTNQLHEKVRADRRVSVREQTDIRSLTMADIGQRVDLVVGDLSFISLAKVMPALVGLARPDAPMLLLIKPQFEAGRQEASKGKGIITDPAIWSRVLTEVRAAADDAGAAMLGVMVSPLTGSSGNVEFVGHFVARADSSRSVDDRPLVGDEAIASVVDHAGHLHGESE